MAQLGKPTRGNVNDAGGKFSHANQSREKMIILKLIVETIDKAAALYAVYDCFLYLFEAYLVHWTLTF